MIQHIHTFASFIDRLGPGFLDMAAKGTAILFFACLLALGARRASAAARHWILLLGFAGLLVLPLLSTSTLLEWKILPRMEREIALAPAAVIDDSPVFVGTGTRVVPNELNAAPETIAAAQTVEKAPAIPVSFWVFCVWAAGVVLFVGRVVLGYVSLAILRKKCTVIRDESWSTLLGDLSEEMNIVREVQLLRSPLRSMPMTWGIRKVCLLLPEQADEWSVDQRRSVLLHELAHVARKDCLAQLFVQIAFAMHWFNPLAWVAGRQLQIERERACDDLALSAGARASDYADHLLKSAVALPAMRFVAAALAMARPSTLEGRLKAILDGKRNRKPLSLAGAMMMILALGAVLVPVAALRAQQKEAAPAKEPVVAAAATTVDPRSPVAGVPATPDSEEGATCKMDAIIYSVLAQADKIGLLDVDELNKVAGDSKEFEKALAKYGEIKPLYRANQAVQLSGDSISISTQNPYVSNQQSTNDGRVINSVQYTSTGAQFSLAGAQQAGGKINLKMEINLSVMGEGAAVISQNVKAPVFRSTKLTHKGVIDAKKPFLIMSIDAASTDSNGAAAVYIAKVILSDLKK